MTFNKPHRLTLAACLLALLGVPAMAQTEGLTMTSMTVTRLDTIPNLDTDMASACCSLHTYESGSDTDFIYLDVDFAVAWTDELDRIQVGSTDIALEIPSETDPRQAWGRVDYFPDVERGATSLNARRPRDFPEDNAGAYMNLVFAVPTGATAATLVIGDPDDGAVMRLPVDLAVPVTELPTAASQYDIKITAITTTPELVTEARLGRNTIAGRMVAGSGAITRLEVELTPFVSTDTDNEPGDNQVFFSSEAFAMVGPEGLPLANLGTTTGSTIRNLSTSIRWDEDEGAPTRSVTLFFLSSGAPGEYRLYFHNQQVGTGVLQ